MAKNDKQWSSATPGLLIILVDKSGSMMLKYKNESDSRTVFATRAINRVINDIIKKTLMEQNLKTAVSFLLLVIVQM